MGNDSYFTVLGPYTPQSILGFYVVAYDTSGNVAYGSEIVPPLPEPPKVAPIVISDEPPNPLPNGEDISYNCSGGQTTIDVNVTELELYQPGLTYNITYSLDGGSSWMNQPLTDIGGYIWEYMVDATTNIIFKIVASDGSSQSRIYWIIVGPWEYPIYLYFSTAEQYYPVKGLDFDGNDNVSNNWASFETTPDSWNSLFINNDIDKDGITEAWSYAYMNPKSLDDGCLVVEYWIYYALNKYPIDNHEHDFESAFIWIDVATGHIKKLACTQHSWVNHYVFDVNDPPLALNLAVENGGHGMALLEDINNDGSPDLNILGSYIIQPGVNQFGGLDLPMFFIDAGTINPQSVVAQLYPWVIYDPRISSSQLHLFNDVSTLTNGLALDAIIPIWPNVVSEIPQYYGYLTDLLTVECVLKTTYGAPLLGGYDLVFCVISPLFREEFRDPAKMWRKVSFGWWLGKIAVSAVVAGEISGAIVAYFGVAGAVGFLSEKALGFLISKLTKQVLDIFVDPIQCSVMDSNGGKLGYPDEQNNLVGGTVLASRNMTNGLYDLYLIFTNDSNEYTYDLKGIESFATYNFTVSLVDSGGVIGVFNATMIPIHAGEVHRSVINWTLLEQGGLGVEVDVDQNGDGVFEHEFSCNSTLTGTQFEQMITHDVAVTAIDHPNATSPKTIVGQGYCMNVSVTTENQGIYDEQFNVTLLTNSTIIKTWSMTSLAPGNQTILLFTWNTSGFVYGNYSLTACADTVPGEIDTGDNNCTSSKVSVTIPGDVNGDYTVDIYDAILLAGCFSSHPSSPHWNPNTDINGDNIVDLYDAIILAGHYNQHYP
jgi:hypothetical protein